MPHTLIVDDDATVLEFLKTVLNRAGWDTDTACDGVEAVLKGVRA